jgi:hypothetical protein
MVPQNTQQRGEKAKFSKIKRHWGLQNKMGGNGLLNRMRNPILLWLRAA